MTGTWRYQWWTLLLLDESSVCLEQLNHNQMLETSLLQNGSTCIKVSDWNCGCLLLYDCGLPLCTTVSSTVGLLSSSDSAAWRLCVSCHNSLGARFCKTPGDSVTGLEQFHSQVRGNAAASRSACSGACETFHLQSFYMPGIKGQTISISKNFADFYKSEDVYCTLFIFILRL